MKKALLPIVLLVAFFSLSIYFLKHRFYNNTPDGPDVAATLTANRATEIPSRTAPAGETSQMDKFPAKSAEAKIEQLEYENKVTDRYAAATVLKTSETEPDDTGRYERKRLVRADFKYPLILLEERIQKNLQTGVERLLRQNAMVADHVMVKVRPGTTENEVNQTVSAYGGQIRKKMYAPNLYLVEFKNPDLDSVAQAIQNLGNDPDLIVYAEPDYIEYALSTTPNDPRFGELWGMNNMGQSSGTPDADIDAPEAWDITTGNSNILVAVIDSGIDYTHPDLAANMWINPGEAGPFSTNGIDDDGNGFIDDDRGWDFYNEDNDSMDDNSHGTHCAGTIGAVGNNDTGVVGVCWDVSLVGIKFLGAGGSGATSDGISATYYAARLGARLISASYGGGSSSQAGYDSIANAGASNMLFIAAAGNSAADNDINPHYPSSYTNENLIAVANSTSTETLSGSSCYGLTSVDLAAPGSSILSTIPGGGYGTKSGTSMATPHVAGAAALMWSHNPAMSAIEVKMTLMSTVDTNAAFAGKMVSEGRLNVDRAIRSLSGLHFDQADYFPSTWATLSLLDNQLAGSVTQSVQITTENGDSETLILYETPEQNYRFTNRIWIVESGSAIPGNSQIESVRGPAIRAVYTNSTLQITNTAIASVVLWPPKTHVIARWGMGNTNIVTNTVSCLKSTTYTTNWANPTVGINYYPDSSNASPYFSSAFSISYSSYIYNSSAGDYVYNYRYSTNGAVFSGMMMWRDFLISTNLTDVTFQGARPSSSTTNLDIRLIVEKSGNYYISDVVVTNITPTVSTAYSISTTSLNWNAFTPFVNATGTIGGTTSVTMDNLTGIGYYFTARNCYTNTGSTTFGVRMYGFEARGVFMEPVTNPVLDYVSTLTTDEDSDGRNELGEAINAYILLSNEGTTASNVTATVIPQGIAASNFEVSNSPGSFGTIATGEYGSNSTPFIITATNPAAPLGVYTFAVTGITSDDSNTVYTAGRSFQINLEQGFSVYGQDAQNTFYMAADFNQLVTNTVMVITNSSGLPLVCTLTESASWLSLPGGTSLTVAPHSASNVTLAADSTGLQGAYSAPLTVTYNQTATNFTSFTVSFIVGPMITPLTGAAVITEVGGVNRLPGQFERGEILNITVLSTNNGAVAVSGITNTLFADPALFAITPSSAAYPVLNAGDSTFTTYQVTISATAPRGTYAFYVTNTAGAFSWADAFDLPVTAQTNRLTVISGSGDGFYMELEAAPVVADTASPGQRFDRWIGDTQYVENETNSSTGVTMPAEDIRITATYIDDYDHEPGVAGLGKLFADPTADAEAIVYSNGYAYVACGYAGLIVFDVSDPINPVRVGGYDTDGFAKALAMQSNKVFVADDRFGLQIVDVTDPSSPVLAGKYATSGSCYDIAVSGQYAYLAAYSSGMLVFDIGNPSSPRQVASYNANVTRAYGIAVNGTYAYVADYTNGLKIIDVSAPANPVLAGSYPVPGQSRDVAVLDGYAYVAAYTNGLQIINVNNPAVPVYTGGYETKYSYGISVEGFFVYLANSGYGVEIIDVSNPAAPDSSGVFNGYTGSANGVFATDGKVYVANDYGGIQIVDVSAPTLPALLGSYDTHRYAYDVAVKGSYAYLAAYRDGLITVDISDPNAPVIVATNKEWATYPYAYRLDISGDTLYVAANFDGLVVYNLANPALPSFVTKYDFVSSGYIRDVKVSGNHVFCVNSDSSSTNTLGVVNVSDPAHPFYVGGYKTGGSAYGIDVQGQYAYLASYTNGLQIFDVSTPSTPVLRGAYRRDTSPYAYRVSVSGTRAYVLDLNDVLQIIDVSNPSSPALERIFDWGGISSDSDIVVKDSLAYIACGYSSYPTNNGFWIVDASDIHNLSATNYPTSGYGRGVAVSGGYVYLADDPKLLHIFEFGKKALTGLSVSGPFSLTPYSTNHYICQATYTDGSKSNASAAASWSLVGDTHGAAMDGNALSVGDISSDSTVTVRAVHGGFTNTLPVRLKALPPIPPGLTPLGRLFDDPSGPVNGMFYSNGYVYAACGYAGVVVYDVHITTNPVRVGGYDTDGEAWRLDMRSNLLFVADSRFGMTILDVSAPINPMLAGEWQDPSQTMAIPDIAVSGDYAYLAATDRGMLVIDISTVSNPRLVAEYKGCRAQGLTVQSNHAYVVNSSNLMHVVNISTPTNPVLARSYPLNGGYELVIRGDYAYVAAATNNLQILDVRDPLNPAVAGSFSPPGVYSIYNLSLDWPYLYHNYGTARILDVSDPASVHVEGTMSIGGLVCAADGKAYVGGNGSLFVVNVTTPSAPDVIGSNDVLCFAYDVVVRDSYAYIAAGADGLLTVDISDPAIPVIVATNRMGYTVYWLDISGDYLYAADNGVSVFSLSDPAAPSFLNRVSYNSSQIRDLRVHSNFVYCADFDRLSTNRLRILDISNPASPRHVFGTNISDIAKGIDVRGNYAYLAAGTNGLLIFDIITKTNAVLRASYARATDPNAGAVSVSGDYAYVLDNKDVLQIINISNLDDLRCTVLDLGAIGAERLRVQEPYVYIAFNNWGSGQNGLWVVDVSDPDNPVAVTNYPTSGFGHGVDIQGGYVYLADDPKLLHTFTWGAVPRPDKFATNLTILGSEEIRVGETNTYSFEMRFSDKSFSYPAVDMSIAGSSHGAVLSSGNILTADAVVSNTAVTLQAEHGGLTDNLTVIVFFDEDGDGVSDRWERQYFGGITGVNPDGICSNGINTILDAYIAGLDPNDPNAAFLTSILPGRILQWDAVSGRVYDIYWTTNLLTSFQPLATNILWPQNSFTNPAVPCGYYKIKVQLGN